MTIKIVLADNHQIVRQGLAQLLAGEPDMRVVGEAEDYCTTIKLIQEFSPQVVIMDISMPDLNGVEATRRTECVNDFETPRTRNYCSKCSV